MILRFCLKQMATDSVNLSLIPEVRYRHYLEKEYRERKHGKSRKLTNADKAAIEEELVIARIPPRQAVPEKLVEAAGNESDDNLCASISEMNIV